MVQTGYGALHTWQDAETRELKRRGNFVGLCIVAMLAFQYTLTLLGRLGLLSWLSALLTTYEAMMAADMVTYLLILVLPTVVVALASGQRINPFPSKRVAWRWWPVLVFGGMAIAIVSNLITGWLMTALSGFGVPTPEMPDTIQPSPVSLGLNLLSTAVLPAIVEEMIFRGYMLGALRRHGDGMAVVLTAALFGFFHGNILQFPFAFILGLGLGYAVVCTDSIWPAVAIHFANNAMSVLIAYFQKCYPDQSLVISNLTFLVVSLLGAVVLTAMLSRREWFAPLGNGLSFFRVRARVGKILSSPLMIAALIAMTAVLIASIGSGLV